MLFSYKEQIGDRAWYEAPVVGSTNDEIKKWDKDRFPVILSAVKQTGGKGRRGRKWQSVEGNLYFTYSEEIEPSELSRFVCLIGLSLAKTVIKLSLKADVKIKWPNDVFLAHKKLSGILIENISDNLWAIGIGVNIKGAPQIYDMPYQATSLTDNGIELDRIEFLKAYFKQYSRDLMVYRKEGFGRLKEEWLSLALNLNQEITIKNDEKSQKGMFLTLDDNGYLILKTEDKEERIIAGDLFIT
jgi:BirA family biotin operon repressor/biotin-[acetyl-CoA-carboxylase] ligase